MFYYYVYFYNYLIYKEFFYFNNNILLVFINIDIDFYILTLFININVDFNALVNDINEGAIKLSFNLYKGINKTKDINSFIRIKTIAKKFE